MSNKNLDFSEIWTKLDELSESVSSIEEGITSGESITLEPETISEISEEIAQAINDDGRDLIDDYEMSMSGREVEIDDITFDAQRINDIVEEILTKKFGVKVSSPKKKRK